MGLELKVGIGRQELMQVKIMDSEWDMVGIAVMLTYQLLIWVICQSHPREHQMNTKCPEMKARVVPISVKTKCVIHHIVTKWEVE